MKEILTQWFIVDSSGLAIEGDYCFYRTRQEARIELRFIKQEALQPWWSYVQWPCRIERRRYKLIDKTIVR